MKDETYDAAPGTCTACVVDGCHLTASGLCPQCAGHARMQIAFEVGLIDREQYDYPCRWPQGQGAKVHG